MLKNLRINASEPINHLTAILLVAGLGASVASGALRAEQPRQLVIEGPTGGDCESLGGVWTTARSTCRMLALSLNSGDTLTIRRNGKVNVRQQFVNDGSITIGNSADPPLTTAELTLGVEDGIGGAGVNRGIIIIVPSTAGAASPGLNNRLFQFVNIGTIVNFKVGDLGGILNNFGEILNTSRINNRGFLHNSGPNVQTAEARIINQGPSGLLSNDSGGIIENLGLISGPVTGPCPGKCE